jgi:type I restriction enzyme, R subunit
VGLEADYASLRKEGKGDADLFLLHINQLIENAVGLAAAANVTTLIHHVDGRDLCRVHVEPSGHPVEAEVTVADERGQLRREQAFFIRLNNGTRAIRDDRERQRYIAQRWSGGAGAPNPT